MEAVRTEVAKQVGRETGNLGPVLVAQRHLHLLDVVTQTQRFDQQAATEQPQARRRMDQQPGHGFLLVPAW